MHQRMRERGFFCMLPLERAADPFSSMTLAQRLNDLAAANAEGLLECVLQTLVSCMDTDTVS